MTFLPLHLPPILGICRLSLALFRPACCSTHVDTDTRDHLAVAVGVLPSVPATKPVDIESKRLRVIKSQMPKTPPTAIAAARMADRAVDLGGLSP